MEEIRETLSQLGVTPSALERLPEDTPTLLAAVRFLASDDGDDTDDPEAGPRTPGPVSTPRCVNPNDVATWDVEGVVQLLRCLNLASLAAMAQAEDIDGCVLASLADTDLKEELELSFGLRRRLETMIPVIAGTAGAAAPDDVPRKEPPTPPTGAASLAPVVRIVYLGASPPDIEQHIATALEARLLHEQFADHPEIAVTGCAATRPDDLPRLLHTVHPHIVHIAAPVVAGPGPEAHPSLALHGPGLETTLLPVHDLVAALAALPDLVCVVLNCLDGGDVADALLAVAHVPCVVWSTRDLASPAALPLSPLVSSWYAEVHAADAWHNMDLMVEIFDTLLDARDHDHDHNHDHDHDDLWILTHSEMSSPPPASSSPPPPAASSSPPTPPAASSSPPTPPAASASPAPSSSEDAAREAKEAKEAAAREAERAQAAREAEEARAKEAAAREAERVAREAEEARAKEARAKEARAKEARAKEARAKEARAKEARAKEARAKEARAKEARAKEAREAEEAKAQAARQAEEARAKEARAKEAREAARAESLRQAKARAQAEREKQEAERRKRAEAAARAERIRIAKERSQQFTTRAHASSSSSTSSSSTSSASSSDLPRPPAVRATTTAATTTKTKSSAPEVLRPSDHRRRMQRLAVLPRRKYRRSVRDRVTALRNAMAHNAYYELFDVSPDASGNAIASARRRLTRSLHPDNWNQDPSELAIATQLLQLMNEAYANVLKRNDTRDVYDSVCHHRAVLYDVIGTSDLGSRQAAAAAKDLRALAKAARKQNMPASLLEEIAMAIDLLQ